MPLRRGRVAHTLQRAAPEESPSGDTARILVVSGIRDIAPLCTADVELALLEEVAGRGIQEIRFGGAIGTDTIALVSAGHCLRDRRLVVVVPFRVSDQPTKARRAIERWATVVVELKLPRSDRAYLRRNDAMLEGAHRLLAFTDGRDTGGTAYTIRAAERRGLGVSIIDVVAASDLRAQL